MKWAWVKLSRRLLRWSISSSAEEVNRFLVVAPANILGTGSGRFTRGLRFFSGYLMHGPQRHKELLPWLERGGVAVTSYEAFRTDDVDGALSPPQSDDRSTSGR